MDADLDLLLTTVFVTADDLLPERQHNAARSITDAEVVTLCVAQAIMGIPSDRRFLAVAHKRLAHLFPRLPKQPGYFKRRRRLADTLEWLMGIFASQSPGFADDLLLIDSTPVECARSRETVKRSGANALDDALGNACDYGYCASHSRYFWGMRLHAIFAPDGTPRALELCSPKIDEREIGLILLDRCQRRGGETLLGDKGYASRRFSTAVQDRGVTFVRPNRKDEATIQPPRSTTAALRPAREITPQPGMLEAEQRRSGNGSNRSSGPAKTSSRSSATAPGPSPDCANASSRASAAWPPRSRSTINSDAQAVHSSTTAPDRAESTI